MYRKQYWWEGGQVGTNYQCLVDQKSAQGPAMLYTLYI